MNKRYFVVLLIQLLSINVLYSQTTPRQIFEKGLEAFYGGNFQDGIKYFTEYIAVAATDPNGFSYRGLCYQSKKDFPRSIDDFTQVITLLKNSPDGYINRGNSYLKSGNFSSAINDFNDAVRFGPNNIEGYMGLANVHMAQGKYPNALKDIILAIGVEPKNARLHFNKAWVHYLNGDTSEIFDCVNNGMYCDSDIVFTNYKREFLFMKAENYKGAMSVINERIKQFPDSYLAYFVRGFIYYLINDYGKSIKDLKKSETLIRIKDEKYEKAINYIYRSIKRNS